MMLTAATVGEGDASEADVADGPMVVVGATRWTDGFWFGGRLAEVGSDGR